MGEVRQWYLVSYDVRESRRLRRVHKWLRGYGEPIQYSVFRVRGTSTTIERLRWELEELMDGTDALIIIPLCSNCAANVRTRNYRGWGSGPTHFVVSQDGDDDE